MNKQIRIVGFLLLIVIGACKDKYVRPISIPLTKEACVIPKNISVLLRSEQLEKIFDIPGRDISIVPNNIDDMRMKGFAIWEEEAFDTNKGIYLSMSRNLYQEYGENYISDMIVSLKAKGESDAEGNRVLYQDFDEVGTEGAYSSELSTYAWQVQNCILFKLVFNTSHSDKEKYQLAVNTSRVITQNYFDYIKSLSPKS